MDINRLFLLTAVLVAAPVAAQNNPLALRAELTARYAAMKSAMASKNESAIRSLLADGFVSVDVSGKSEDASDMIKEVLALPPDPSRQSHTTLVSLTPSGDSVIVEQRYDMTKKTRAADGTQKAVALSTLSRDRWINDTGAWRIVRTVTEQMDYSVDGVIVLHKVNASSN